MSSVGYLKLQQPNWISASDAFTKAYSTISLLGNSFWWDGPYKGGMLL
jgi:hypothetical protein